MDVISQKKALISFLARGDHKQKDGLILSGSTITYDLTLNSTNARNTLLCTIDLSNCDLTELPLTVKLPNLKHLNLSNNKLEKVPKCLYLGLEALEELDLSHNLINDFDMEPLCRQSLKILKLECNKLGHVPQWILALRGVNLQQFDFSQNSVDRLRCLFDNTEKLKIRSIIMRNCMLRNCDFNFFKNLHSLEYLDISNERGVDKNKNNFLDIDVLFVKPLWRDLSVLKLNNLVLSIFPDGICWLESLVELYVAGNYLHWLPENGLEFLVNLKVIDLSENNLCKIPEKLLWLENLRSLRASFNLLEVVSLAGLTSLVELDLYHNCITEFDEDLSCLKYVDLEQNAFDTIGLDGSYQEKKNAYRKLNKLRMDGPRELSDCTKSISDHSSESEDSYSNVSYDMNKLEGDTFYRSFVETEECWDEVEPTRPKFEGITPSDDEWNGLEEIVFKEKSSTIKVYNEDWMFCDAENS